MHGRHVARNLIMIMTLFSIITQVETKVHKVGRKTKHTEISPVPAPAEQPLPSPSEPLPTIKEKIKPLENEKSKKITIPTPSVSTADLLTNVLNKAKTKQLTANESKRLDKYTKAAAQCLTYRVHVMTLSHEEFAANKNILMLGNQLTLSDGQDYIVLALKEYSDKVLVYTKLADVNVCFIDTVEQRESYIKGQYALRPDAGPELDLTEADAMIQEYGEAVNKVFYQERIQYHTKAREQCLQQNAPHTQKLSLEQSAAALDHEGQVLKL